MNEIRKEKISIAEILRRTEMKRATCIYHLNKLEIEGLIKRERIEFGETGRPTIISLK